MSIGARRERRPVLAYWLPLVATVSIATVGLVSWAIHAHASAEESATGYDSDGSETDGSDESDRPNGPTNRNRTSRKMDRNRYSDDDTSDEARSARRDGAGGVMLDSPPNSGSRIQLVDREQEELDGAARSDQESVMTSVKSSVSRIFSAVTASTQGWLSESVAEKTEPETQEPSLAAAAEEASRAEGFNYPPSESLVSGSTGGHKGGMVDVVAVVDQEARYIVQVNRVATPFNLIVLVYSPQLIGKNHVLDSTELGSSASSYSAISMPTTLIDSPELLVRPSSSGILEEEIKAKAGAHAQAHIKQSYEPEDENDTVFEVARALVNDDANVIRFTTPDGWKSLVKHLKPTVTYVPAWFTSKVPDKGKDTVTDATEQSEPTRTTYSSDPNCKLLPTADQIGGKAPLDLASLELITTPIVIVKHDGGDIVSDQPRLDGRFRGLVDETGMSDDLISRLPPLRRTLN